MTMNILHTECSMNWGGQEFRTVLEHNYLNQKNHTSWILCHPDSQIYRKGIDLGANMISMNLNSVWRIDNTIRLFIFCKRNKIDIINSHGSKDSILSLLVFWGISL